MKKITLAIDGQIDEQGAKELSSALNDLSGVVAADVVTQESKAYAYAGDQLDAYTVSSKARDVGFGSLVLKEEYITDVHEYKESLFPHAAPVESILSD